MRQADGKRIALLIATGLMLLFIFVQSLLPQSVSAEESGWFTDKVIDPLLGLLGLPPASHHTIRKLAHVAEFAILSLLLALCFHGKIGRSAGAGFAAAFADESIQLLSGRGASVADIWIDLIGIAIGSFVGYLIVRTMRRRTERS